MTLCIGLAEQLVLLHVVRQAAVVSTRAPPSAAESAVSVHLLVVSGSRGSEAAAQETLLLNAPGTGRTVFTMRRKHR